MSITLLYHANDSYTLSKGIYKHTNTSIMKKKRAAYFLLALLFVFYSCHKYADVLPITGHATFGFSETVSGTGGRIASASTPTVQYTNLKDIATGIHTFGTLHIWRGTNNR